jgi:hypothetical protein
MNLVRVWLDTDTFEFFADDCEFVIFIEIRKLKNRWFSLSWIPNGL